MCKIMLTRAFAQVRFQKKPQTSADDRATGRIAKLRKCIVFLDPASITRRPVPPGLPRKEFRKIAEHPGTVFRRPVVWDPIFVSGCVSFWLPGGFRLLWW